jgi:hypothetical protein
VSHHPPGGDSDPSPAAIDAALPPFLSGAKTLPGKISASFSSSGSRCGVLAWVTAFRRVAVRGWRRHEAHEDYFEVEAGDPLHEPGQGCLIWQLGAKGCRAWAGGDLAVVEFRAQRGTCPAGEGDLIRL